MDSIRARPKLLMAVAYGIALAVVVLIGSIWGWGRFLAAFDTVHWGGFWVLVAGSVLGPVAYVICYRELSRVSRGPELPAGLAARIVALGFGPFVPKGGFGTDHRALVEVTGDETEANTQVLAVGALELAVLTPVAWVCALILLVAGVRAPMPSELWPWIVLVPVGFAIAFTGIFWVRRRHPDAERDGFRGAVTRLGYGASRLLGLPGRPDGRAALAGMAGYWFFDIAAFVGACAFVGLHIDLAEAILAYATGYLLTRRSLPLGGAGVAEALMTFALHWVGQPIPLALAVVVLYRLFNFVAPALPALWARNEIGHLVGPPAERRAGAGDVSDARA